MPKFVFLRRFWLLLALTVFMGWGIRSAEAAPSFLINEIDVDTPGTDSAEFIELYDGGDGNSALDGLVVVLFNGNGDTSYAAYDLDGYSTDANGYFVLGNSAVQPDLTFSDNKLQNGPDAVALYSGDAADFPNGSAVTPDNLIDAIVYDTNDADDAGLLPLLNAGQSQVDETAGGNVTGHSSQRCDNATGGARTTSTYQQHAPSPGSENLCGGGNGGGEFGMCGDSAEFIHSVQGAGASSPMVGQTVILEGVVVADFQMGDELSGFFLQEEDSDADANPQTSEGIFVYDAGFGTDVAMGDLVRVQGVVAEYNGLTELTNILDVAVCADSATASAETMTLPVASLDEWERVEGMAVTLNQTLTATESYDLGRYGEMVLAAGGRLYQPTNVAAPGQAANDVQAANDLRRILIDDGSTESNPAVVPYLAADDTLRAGDTTNSVTGVVSYAFDSYRIQPTAEIDFTRANPRQSQPSVAGRLTIASFNVLNYFNGDGQGGGYPTPRGSDTAEEFERQRAKIINALVAMDADVIGLMEIENDGFGPQSAIQDLVDGLNAAAPASTTYAFIDPGLAQIGTDEITVGLLYRTETVQPVASAETTSAAPFNTRNRQPLVQSFEEISTGERFTVAVNHFKSKGSCPSSGENAAQGDGQGCWNVLRTEAANALVDWLNTYPTGVVDPDMLIMGDLNAYAMEDPITAIKDAGYTDLIQQYVGDDAYSYVFGGQFGYLDHALASATLGPQVADAMEWHINADEPRALDYNDFNQEYLYAPTPFRASDHDPVLIGINLGDEITYDLYLPTVATPAEIDPTPAPTPSYPAVNAASENRIVALINQARQSRGLATFSTQPELVQSARRHSSDMASHNFTDHTGSDGTKGGQRMTDAGYGWSTWAEIIGWGFGGDEAAMVDWWLNSPTHHDILVSTRFVDQGAGYDYQAGSTFGHYWTVNFGKRAAPGEADLSQRQYTCQLTAETPDGLSGVSVIIHSTDPCDT